MRRLLTVLYVLSVLLLLVVAPGCLLALCYDLLVRREEERP
jgi:hypothetical protein